MGRKGKAEKDFQQNSAKGADDVSKINFVEELKSENVVENKKQSLFSRAIGKIKAKKQKKLEEIENTKLTEEESKILEEKMEEASKEVSKSSTKKTKIKNIIFFIINIVLVAGILIWNIFTTDDFSPLNIFKIDYTNLLYMLLLLAAIILLDVLSVHRMIYRKTMRSRWNTSYKSLGIMRYYDAVTPMASGGQAFMVTYLTSRDIPGSTALSIPISKLLFQNIAWLIVTGVCLIISFATGLSSLVSAASVIGYILCFLLVAFIIFVSFSKKMGKRLVTWGLKLLKKLHLVKDYEKTYAKVTSFVEDYQNIMKEYSHAKFDVIYQLILHGLRFVCLYSIPFFIYKIFPYEAASGYPMGSYGTFFVFAALIELAASFIPLPGGTGMNEITFSFLFGAYLGGNTFWALLLWRFCSYYFYLLQGIGIITYDTVYGNRKYRWVKKKLALQSESQQFRRVQIENFRRERDNRRKKQSKRDV